MGNMMYAYVTNTDTAPDPFSPPTFDPLLGFPNGRKERVMIATEDQMEAAKMPLDRRDYCSHFYLEFMKCRKRNFPWVAACKHELHNYDTCEFDDYVIRMKEYEREKRLKERAKRIAAKNKDLLIE